MKFYKVCNVKNNVSCLFCDEIYETCIILYNKWLLKLKLLHDGFYNLYHSGFKI